ncbi:MAG TPA: hypothetical protein VFT37_05105 [Telluria sp.]|nr:hypothetical protein [Telluria sp.]
MTANLSTQLLRIGLALRAVGPVGIAAALVIAGSAAALGWILPERAARAQQHRATLALAATTPAVPAVVAQPQAAGIDAFYDALGERRYAEQQLRTLFGLAAKAGLSLTQGEYRTSYDRNARVHAYQVTLPVRGSYRAVWGFAMSALTAIPFASLDEISFKRDAIGDASVEARLRLTLYLAGTEPK